MKQGTVFLLRHGHTVETSHQCYIGQSDVELSPSGIRQAEEWADWFSRVPLKHVACSDLKRSAETAAIIGRRCEIQPTVFPKLKEIDLGEWEGLAFQYVRTHYPDDYRRRGELIAAFRPPGGESFLDLQARVIPQFQQIMDTSEETILIVGHAGTNRVLLCHILGMPLKNLFRIKQDFGALNMVEIHSSGWRVQSLNLALRIDQPRP